MDSGWLAFLGGLIAVILGTTASLITARFGRTSQAESNKINEANGIVERYEKLTNSQADEATRKEAEHVRIESGLSATAERLAGQVSLWRRYATKLRGQIHQLGGTPVEPDEKLEL